MENLYQPLKIEDVQEKIKLNREKGIDIKKLRDLLYEELFSGERTLLKVKSTIHPIEIQNQNLREQLKIIEGVINHGS